MGRGHPAGGASTDPSTPVLALPGFELSPVGDGDFEGSWNGFTRAGAYKVAIYAADSDGDISLPAPATVTQLQAVVVTGDVDDSGGVDLADAVIALRAVAGMPVASELRAGYPASGADVNGDGAPGLAEAVYGLQAVAGR